jgi:hypothetical protein
VIFWQRLGVAGVGCLLWILGTVAGLGQDNQDKKPDRTSEHLLPATTRAWVSVPNPQALNDAFAATQLGQLANDEQLQPFVNDLREQIRAGLSEDGRRHGLRLSQFEDLNTGEICLAGILPKDALGEVQRNKHGIILLVQVAKCREEAEKVLADTANSLRENKAVSTTETFDGIEATKWTFPKSEHMLRERTAYHAIAGDWLISSDNAELFGQVVHRIVTPDEPAEETLDADPVFTELQKRTVLDEGNSTWHVRWFVDPFGYLDLARLIAEEDQDPETRQRSMNFAKIVKNSGFDAIKGAAGNLAFSADQKEVLHRVFVYAPPVEAAGANKYPKAGAVLDFVNSEGLSFEPESWVPESSASYVTFCWNLDKLVNHIHHVVDAVTDENSFENMLKNIKESNNVDVRKAVECLNNRISVVTDVAEPIDLNSEKIVVGIGIRKDEDFIRQQVKNFFGSALKIEKAGEVEIYYEELVPEIEEDDLFGNMEEFDEEGGDEEEGTVIEQKFVAIHEGYVLVSTDKEFLKSIIMAKPQAIAGKADFGRVQKALEKYADPTKISLRQFSRLNRVLKVNYELLRNDELRSANTLFAKFMGVAREEAEKGGLPPRKFDPAKMPDFESTIAPNLGPTGWVIESKDDGWQITSCLLKREPVETAVTKDAPEEHPDE